MKKYTLTAVIIVIISSVIIAFKGNEPNTVNKKFIENPADFRIQKGVNISHWMSQCADWAERDNFFTKEDVVKLRSYGFDHIRLPIDEEELWDETGKVKEDALKYLNSCIKWCLEENMRIIVDLHILRSHHFNARNNEGKITLWTDTVAQNNFIQLWRNLSAYLKKYPVSMLAYEPMNEPVAPEHEQWNKLLGKAIKEIRKLEPNRTIIVGSNRWQKPHTFPFLDVPANDRNIILSVHTYHPYFVTHYQAFWSAAKDYKGPVKYPGQCITQEDYKKYVDTTNIPLVSRLKEEKALETYNYEKLVEIMLPAIKRAKELNLQLYCNEFGCLPNIDRETRLRYYKDIVKVFNDNNIAYANWDYKGNFSIVDYDREKHKTIKADYELIKILTGKDE